MNYNFKKENRTEALINNFNAEHIRWMNFILRQSKRVGEIELPISAVILDERGRCIER